MKHEPRIAGGGNALISCSVGFVSSSIIILFETKAIHLNGESYMILNVSFIRLLVKEKKNIRPWDL